MSPESGVGGAGNQLRWPINIFLIIPAPRSRLALPSAPLCHQTWRQTPLFPVSHRQHGGSRHLNPVFRREVSEIPFNFGPVRSESRRDKPQLWSLEP